MPQSEVWFYLLPDALETTRLQFIVKFCDAATRRSRRAVLLCNDLSEAEHLDLAIWQDSRPESFIAHSIDNQCPAPIQLLTANMPTEGDILLNLTNQLLTVTGYQRIVEIVNPDSREASRARWRHYQQLGLSPELKPI
jgi:DNA polymerase IIIc chi subunit